MSPKQKTNIYLDEDVKRVAQQLGLNISQVCENALKVTIGAVSEALYGGGPGPGFEPGRQASLPVRQQATQEHLEKEGAYRPVSPAAGVQIPSPASLRSAGSGGPIFSIHSQALGYQTTSPRPLVLRKLGVADDPALMADFKTFLVVDLRREKLTVEGHTQAMARFLEWLPGNVVTRDLIRDYLQRVEETRGGAYKNELSALKVFFRDYVQRPDLVATFKFPRKELELKQIPPTKNVRKFYYALKPLDLRMACYYLLYATSGWRRREVMALRREDVDLESRFMRHRVKSSSTKGRLIGLFNEEAQEKLKEFDGSRRDTRPTLLPITERTFRALWHQAADACGLLIDPLQLREWFCDEMGNLKVPDRYIDAFCGRVPKSVLAKHYSDYAPAKLKRIYDRAGLTVLS